MRLFVPVFVVAFGSILCVTAEDCRGCVPLDSLSFQKVIPKFKATLVKFDVAFPYGEKHEEYGKVAIDTKELMDLLVAEIGVKDFGNKDNSDLAQRYNVKKEDFPAVMLFVEGTSEPYRFTVDTDEDFTAENIKRFVRTNSKIYLGLPGCVEKLDRIAESFAQASNENDRKTLLDKGRVYEDTLPEEHRAAARVYVKTMERILERGDVFVQTERARIDGLLTGKLSKKKKREIEQKRNILQSFSHRDEL